MAQMTSKEKFDVDCQDAVENSGLFLEVVPGEQFLLKYWLAGPRETPYENGTFEVEILFPTNYPTAKPLVTFCTNIWHLDVDPQTNVMSLPDTSDFTISTVLKAIDFVLEEASPGVGTSDYKTAEFWKQLFASSLTVEEMPNSEELKKFHNLTDLGFDRKKSLIALSRKNWNQEAAADALVVEMTCEQATMDGSDDTFM